MQTEFIGLVDMWFSKRFGVGAVSGSNTALADRFRVPQFVAEQEFGVEGTLSPFNDEVEGKVVISSSS